MACVTGLVKWQPPAICFQTGSIRVCHLAGAASGAWPCSTKSNLPPGLNTRFASESAAAGSCTEHRVNVVTTVSKLPLAKGRASATPIAKFALRPACASSAAHAPEVRLTDQCPKGCALCTNRKRTSSRHRRTPVPVHRPMHVEQSWPDPS
jgi:hypothetical protein